MPNKLFLMSSKENVVKVIKNVFHFFMFLSFYLLVFSILLGLGYESGAKKGAVTIKRSISLRGRTSQYK